MRGTYGEVPIRLKVELPVVERNKVYELAVLNVGAEVTGVFEIKPWEEGETIVGKPDTNQRLLLNASKSRIPEGVKVDYENNIVEVPATGADDMTLAFVTDTRIDISSTEGAGSGTSVGNMSAVSYTHLVKIIGLLLEICLLAVIRYKFVLYLICLLYTS